MVDQRASPRFAVNREFSTVAEFIREYALNVSLGGCFIRTTERLTIGMEVDLCFTLILDELETISGTGRVVRVVAPGGNEPPGVGVIFTSLTAPSREVLVRLFLERRERSGVAVQL